MKPLNFVNSHVFQKRKSVYTWAIVSIACLVSTCFVIGYLQINQMRKYIQTKTQLQTLNKQICAQQALTKKQIDLENQLALISQDSQDPKNRGMSAHNVIALIAKVLPNKVRLEQLIYSPKKITLSGYALSLGSLTKFIQVISAQKEFAEVKLMRAKRLPNAQELQFEMNLVLPVSAR